jgi:hypothetical protein
MSGCDGWQARSEVSVERLERTSYGMEEKEITSQLKPADPSIVEAQRTRFLMVKASVEVSLR